MLERVAPSGALHLWAAWVSILRRGGLGIQERVAHFQSFKSFPVWVLTFVDCIGFYSQVLQYCNLTFLQSFILAVFHSCIILSLTKR